MNRKILPLTLLVIMALLLFAPTAYAADALYHFMHNSHDALILGHISSVEDGICTIMVSETIVSPVNAVNASPKRLLEPQMACINAADILYYGHENRPPLLNDNVLISVDQVAGDMFAVANGAYLVNGLDKLNFSVILAEGAPSRYEPAAAAVECFMLSNAQISTYLFYQDTAVGFYMSKDRNPEKIMYIYYQGYNEVKPRTPVPGSLLPQPGMAPTFEVFAGTAENSANIAPVNTQPIMAQTMPMAQHMPSKTALPLSMCMMAAVLLCLTALFIWSYKKQLSLPEIYQKLGEAEEQANNGVPNIDGKKVFNRLRSKYGQRTI